MTKIKLLPIHIINQIAAGEVIERPASIIKELVENSIDSGATQIEIYINNGGKTLITVKDNGSGMLKEDLFMCLNMHATSKLNNNDIFNIKSLGFRGEALASIAAVSKISISSFDTIKQQAFTIFAENSVINNNLNPSTLQAGTTVTVSDLFFSTPARLKFLKSDVYETISCYSTIKKLALANANCNFKVFNNNKLIYNYTNNTNNINDAIKLRLMQVIGNDFEKNSLLINASNNLFTIYGYTSIPTYNSNNSNLQYININNRNIKDKFITQAIKFAYTNVLEKGKFPIFGVWITINPTEIDVNVNPSKSEVRFKDAQLVKHLLLNIIKNVLANPNYQTNSTTLSNKLINKSLVANTLSDSAYNIYTNYNLNSNKPNTTSNLNNKLYNSPSLLPFKGLFNNNNDLLGEKHPLGFAQCQLNNNWIISQTAHGLIIIDQHAAHERIVEETLKNSFLNNNIAVQNLLNIENFTLDEEAILLLTEFKSNIAKIGITFNIVNNIITVTTLPSLIANASPKQIIIDVINNIKATQSISSVIDKLQYVIIRLACHYSIRSGRKMNINEMNELLRKMEKTPNYAQCSHGRPTFIEVSFNNLEKIFGR